MELLDWLQEPLRFALFQRSLLALLLIGVLSGVVGSLVVVRGIAFWEKRWRMQSLQGWRWPSCWVWILC